ncbi:MAG: C13 family peptidase [Pseudomonadota bacterium]
MQTKGLILLAGVLVAGGFWLRTDPVWIPADAGFADGSGYHGDLVNGRPHGKGRLDWGNGRVYRGQFANGKANGSGHFQNTGGSVYSGQVVDGLFHGLGRLTESDGTVYKGEFSQDQFSGLGIMEAPNGQHYAGEFRQWRFHGYGEFSEGEGGPVYTGRFENGQFVGPGRLRLPDGRVYEGEFDQWLVSGKGRWVMVDGSVYAGHFESGQLHGGGAHIKSRGGHYVGDFRAGEYHGSGELLTRDGDFYSGAFARGYKHGKGELIYAEEKGLESLSGIWQYGEYTGPEGERPKRYAQAAEAALYRQNHLIQSAAGNIRPGTPGKVEVYFVGIAGDGDDEVFRRELDKVNELTGEWWDTSGRQVLLSNHPDTGDRYPLATETALRKLLKVTGERMNPGEDILWLHFTSHGSSEHALYLNHPNIQLPNLEADSLKSILEPLTSHYQVLTLSACYSGGLIPHLSHEKAMILAAAREDRTSFGCSDHTDMTYFSKALYGEAMPRSQNIRDAYEKTREAVTMRENSMAVEEHSEPQWHAGKSVEPYLERHLKWPRPAAGIALKTPEATQ